MAGSDAKTPAPAKDRISGSKVNPKGSASSGRSRDVKFSDKTEKALKSKVEEHNSTASNGRRASLGMLKAVYRRGAGAFSQSHRPGMSRDQWAMGRVNAFLKLLKSGKPSNPNYKSDNDLLPSGHPKSTRGMKSDGYDDYADELIVVLCDEDEYESPEAAIISLTEYMGLGYEAEPAIRAAWLRGVNSSTSPYQRALDMAEYVFNSNDSDLLPIPEKGVVE